MTGERSDRALAREAIVRSFRWVNGHADVWRLFEDGPALAAVTAALAESWAHRGVTKVAGIEARGFLLGGAVALRLGVGFAAVRKGEALFPGEKLTVETAPDYRGVKWQLRIRTDSLGPDDQVLLVDDWAERGSQALAARQLVEACGASFLGLSLIVDQLPERVRAQLGRLTAIVGSDELPPPE